MALTLSSGTTNLRSVVRSLCFESDGQAGLFTTQQLDDFINLAHRELYAIIVDAVPSYFATRSSDLSITSSGYSFAGTALTTNGVFLINRVEYKDAEANYFTLPAYDRNELPQVNGPLVQWEGDAVQGGWFLEAEKVYLYPQPSGTKTIRMTYVPNVADLSASTDQPFGGVLPGYHDTVAYLTAALALQKDEAAKFIEKHYDRKLLQLLNHIRRRHAQGPRTVRMIDGGREFEA